ncbi:hypothetical protein ACQ4PT_015166 [Festuca glaucescens]
MEANQHRQESPAPPPPARSRTRRDPAEDHVYRVPPQDFAHTVQRLTGAPPPLPLPRRGDQQPSSAPPPPPTFSMQEAYLEWCDSNSVLLSPGTMAEIDRAARFNIQG